MIIHVHFPKATATVIMMVKKLVLWASNELHWTHIQSSAHIHIQFPQ